MEDSGAARKGNSDVGIEVTLRDIYEMNKDTRDRVQHLEREIDTKMDFSDMHEKTIELCARMSKIETKQTAHIKRTEGQYEGTERTHNLWIKLLTGAVTILAILQAFSAFITN